MRHLPGLFAAALAIPVAASAQAPGPATPPRLEIAECLKRVAAGTAIVIDVRSAEAYAAGHVAGALSVPLDTVAAKAGELKKLGKAVVAYCA